MKVVFKIWLRRMVFNEWKRDIEKKLSRIPEDERLEKIPALIQRCPKCHSLSLEFDADSGKIRCRKCGFEEVLPVME